MNARLVATALLPIIFTAATVSAEALWFDVRDMVHRSDLIVVGTISMTDLSSRRRVPLVDSGPPTPVAVVVEVSHVLKGHVNSKQLAFRSSVREAALRRTVAQSYGILFLKQNGHLDFVSEYHPIVHVVDGPPVQKADPVEAVVETIGTILHIPTASTTMRQQAAESDIRRAAYWAIIAEQDKMRDAFLRALDDADQRVRFNSVTILRDVSGKERLTPEAFRQNEYQYITESKERLTTTRR